MEQKCPFVVKNMGFAISPTTYFIQYPVQINLGCHVVLLVVECSDPDGVPHSTRSWSKWPYTPNTQFRYTCGRCYTGGGNITCQNNGEWTNKPNCTGKKPIFTFKRSAGVAPEVNLRNQLHPVSGLNRIDFPTSRKVDAVDPSG